MSTEPGSCGYASPRRVCAPTPLTLGNDNQMKQLIYTIISMLLCIGPGYADLIQYTLGGPSAYYFYYTEADAAFEWNVIVDDQATPFSSGGDEADFRISLFYPVSISLRIFGGASGDNTYIADVGNTQFAIMDFNPAHDRSYSGEAFDYRFMVYAGGLSAYSSVNYTFGARFPDNSITEDLPFQPTSPTPSIQMSGMYVGIPSGSAFVQTTFTSQIIPEPSTLSLVMGTTLAIYLIRKRIGCPTRGFCLS